jgi:hypothetical protein
MCRQNGLFSGQSVEIELPLRSTTWAQDGRFSRPVDGRRPVDGQLGGLEGRHAAIVELHVHQPVTDHDDAAGAAFEHSNAIAAMEVGQSSWSVSHRSSIAQRMADRATVGSIG